MVLHQLQPVAAKTGTPLRVAFWTLGCRLNQYDTESLKTSMSGLYDLDVVAWHEPAQVYVLNSCTVTARADQECRRLARQVKRRHPHSKVVVVGCYAQTQPDALAAVPEIDGVVGNATKDDIQSWLPSVLGDDLPTLRSEEFAEDPVFDAPLVENFPGRSRALVKIQDGCNLRCTYCLIWRARGPGRSRQPDDIKAQLQRLVDQGYAETVLAGIHLGGYGRDLTEGLLLPGLLREILAAFPGLRLRLSSIHPNEVTPELLALYGKHLHLQPHLHVSLQSGSSSVLKRMKRPYRRARAWAAVAEAAAAVPGMGIGADIIVGFPGESDEEFAATREMVTELPFSYLHVFRFSQRPGTAAAEMPDQVPPKVIARRSEVLRQIATEKSDNFAAGLVGNTREAVVEAVSGESGWRQATTDNYVTVLVPDRGVSSGSLVRVGINKWQDQKLYGEIETVLNPGQPAESGV